MVTDATKSPPTTCAPQAKELWKYQETKYKKKDLISALYNFQLFSQAVIVDDGTVEAQLNKLYELHTKAAISGFVIDDWHFATKILISLPTSFQHIKDSFLTTPSVKDLKPSDVCDHVIEAELHHLNDTSASSVTTNILSTKKPAGGNNKKKPTKGTRPNKPPPSTKPRWHCNKKGHWAAQCLSNPNKGNNQNAASPSNQKDKDKGPNLNIVTTPNVTVTTSSEQSTSVWSLYLYAFGSPKNWLFDTGASDHMTPFGSDFI